MHENVVRAKCIVSSPNFLEASILQVQNLSKQYAFRKVVKNVSLTIKSGEVVGLLGPNGAGKTTCFYMIVGLISVDGGSISLDNKFLSSLPVHKRALMGLAYLPQEASIFRKLSVADNIRAILELHFEKKFDKQFIEEKLNNLLDELQINSLRNSKAISLSGGERRRVEIARTLALNPRFILLDEPFAGVDPIAIHDIGRIITFLKKRGIGILITDHNVRETLGICDRAYIISDGEVLASGAPKEIIDNNLVRQAYLGENFKM